MFITYETAIMSYRQIFYQIIFATKSRRKTIAEAHGEELYKYIWGIVKNKTCKIDRINGIEDPIHVFSDIHPSISLADYVRDIKASSNIWMKNRSLFPEFRGWQESYGTLTFSIKERDIVLNYVKNQKKHHKNETFYDTYKRLLIENGVESDENISTPSGPHSVHDLPLVTPGAMRIVSLRIRPTLFR